MAVKEIGIYIKMRCRYHGKWRRFCRDCYIKYIPPFKEVMAMNVGLLSRFKVDK